jgi:hypothetical protein
MGRPVSFSDTVQNGAIVKAGEIPDRERSHNGRGQFNSGNAARQLLSTLGREIELIRKYQ